MNGKISNTTDYITPPAGSALKYTKHHTEWNFEKIINSLMSAQVCSYSQVNIGNLGAPLYRNCEPLIVEKQDNCPQILPELVMIIGECENA